MSFISICEILDSVANAGSNVGAHTEEEQPDNVIHVYFL